MLRRLPESTTILLLQTLLSLLGVKLLGLSPTQYPWKTKPKPKRKKKAGAPADGRSRRRRR